MKSKILSICVFLCVLLSSSLALAYNVPARPDGPVYDGANVLTANQEQKLDQDLQNFYNQKGITVVVATIPTLGGNSIEGVANKIFNTWGIGDAKENKGVLLLIVQDKALKAGPGAKKCGCLRIEVGKFLEGDLPDTLVFGILKKEVLGPTVNGNFNIALTNGSKGIMSVLSGTSAGKYKNNSQESSELSWWDGLSLGWQIFLMVLFLIVFLYISVQAGGSGSYGGGSYSSGGGGSSGGSFGGFGGGSSGGGGASL